MSDASLGIVVVGRNEGERLRSCLASARATEGWVVYVDSGSTDGSVDRAREQGVEVVALDPSRPFTAARARNAGWLRLRELRPGVSRIQFVDGDCELQPGWVEAASQALEDRPDVAVVCGRRRERRPEATLYNRLADLEWDTPVGEVESCGGDAMIRAEALEAVGGFDPGLIAGEEPDLCLRIRRLGHRVLRLDREMTLHDAGMDRFSQWWRRQARAGHAYAEAAFRYGRGPERFRIRELASVVAWGLALPLLAVAGAPLEPWLALALPLGYGALWLRVLRSRRGPGRAAYATAGVLGKLAQAQGVLTFAWNRLRGRPTALIEYKAAQPGSPRTP